jgi:hypothetical protein
MFIQKINNIVATIKPVTFESHIADQDFLNQIFVAEIIFSHDFNSSCILSNISIFASIAIQTDRINPAIEARVKVIPKILTINRIINTYNINDTDARKPANL